MADSNNPASSQPSLGDVGGAATGTEGKKKRRAPQGPRKPSPLYAFVRINGENKPELAQSFRDPRKMAEYFPTASANGEHLLILTPEA